MNPLLAIDLCCGAGGWAFAARGLPIRFLAVIDTAEDCRETWRINHAADHPDVMILDHDLSDGGAVTNLLCIIRERLQLRDEGIDLVLGGIPCEPVSTVRYCGGKDRRPTVVKMSAWHRLIDHCLEIVRELAVPYWAIEDVIQIERHLPTWFENGGEIPLRRIQARDFGPQRRLRTFLGRFPQPLAPVDAGLSVLRDCLIPGPHMTIPRPETYERSGAKGRNQGRMENHRVRVLDPDGLCPTVPGGLDRGSRQRRAFMTEDGRGRLRKLDWWELALVQGFPEDALFAAGLIRASKMVGQAIPIQVGWAILEAIVEDAGEKSEGGMQKAEGPLEAAPCAGMDI